MGRSEGGYFLARTRRMLHFGNAFFNSATPALVTLVRLKPSVLSCCNLATSLRLIAQALKDFHGEE